MVYYLYMILIENIWGIIIMKKIINMLLLLVMVAIFSSPVSATHNGNILISENPMSKKDNVLTNSEFVLTVDVLEPDGKMIPATMSFTILTKDGEWLYNRHIEVKETGRYEFVFPVPEYKIGEKFKIFAMAGVKYINYCDVDLAPNQEFLAETYAYVNENGELVVSNGAHITACPLSTSDSWETMAESLVNSQGISSETPYLIWVSKENFTVSVFLNENGAWDCIKQIPCSIGAPKTPTITGEYKYYQYQTRWQYDGYYVGPIMRFYNGYAIHTTLINNDGTDRDARVGKMISHGCVRVRPEDMSWLVDYVPKNTKIYITNS